MLTEKQKNNIHRLPFEEQLEILDICIDALGIEDIEGAKNALGVSRSRVYQLMDKKNTLKIGKHRFPCINIIIQKI
jgi:hypothetical protein